MLFTERKALEEMFSYLEQDKRTIKAQARQDIENIENRQMQILDRLQRLDDVEREAVDVEGVLHQLATTAQELGQLIPQVPFTDVLERAAQLVAEQKGDQIGTGDPAKTVIREKIVEAARTQKVNAPKQKRTRRPQVRGLNDQKGIEALVAILQAAGKPLDTGRIKELFETMTGIEYTNFYAKLKEWTKKSKGKIIKDDIRKVYYLKENQNHDQRTTEERKEKTLV